MTTFVRFALVCLLFALPWSASAQNPMKVVPDIETCNSKPTVAERAKCAVDNVELYISAVESALGGTLSNAGDLPLTGSIPNGCGSRVFTEFQTPVSCDLKATDPTAQAFCRRANANRILEGQASFANRLGKALQLIFQLSETNDPLATEYANQAILTTIRQGRVHDLVRKFRDGEEIEGTLRIDNRCNFFVDPPDPSVIPAFPNFVQASNDLYFRLANAILGIADDLFEQTGDDAISGSCFSPFPALRQACTNLAQQWQVVLGNLPVSQLAPLVGPPYFTDAYIGLPVIARAIDAAAFAANTPGVKRATFQQAFVVCQTVDFPTFWSGITTILFPGSIIASPVNSPFFPDTFCFVVPIESF